MEKWKKPEIEKITNEIETVFRWVSGEDENKRQPWSQPPYQKSFYTKLKEMIFGKNIKEQII